MKNYNQITIPAGILLVLIGFVAKFFMPELGITVSTDWLAFFFLGGLSLILLSIEYIWTIIAGFVLLASSLVFLLIALT